MIPNNLDALFSSSDIEILKSILGQTVIGFSHGNSDMYYNYSKNYFEFNYPSELVLCSVLNPELKKYISFHNKLSIDKDGNEIINLKINELISGNSMGSLINFNWLRVLGIIIYSVKPKSIEFSEVELFNKEIEEIEKNRVEFSSINADFAVELIGEKQSIYIVSGFSMNGSVQIYFNENDISKVVSNELLDYYSFDMWKRISLYL